MRYFIFIFFIVSLIVVQSCKNEQKNPENKSTRVPDEIDGYPKLEGGFSYKVHKQNKGPKPQIGEYAYADMIVTSNGAILKSTYTYGEPAKIRINGDVAAENISPTAAALKTMAVGDSMTIVVRGDKYVDQLKGKGLTEASGDIVYQLVLRAIKTEKEFNAENDAAIKKIKQNSPKGPVKPITIKTKTIRTE